MRSFVSFSPGVCSGEPTLNGTRLHVRYVATKVAHAGLQAAMDEFDISREDVLVCCWFVGSYGPDGDPLIHEHFEDWADQWHGTMWKGRWDEVPDPPTFRGEA